MKNRWKNTAFFAQVMVLCLCLAACGNSDDVAGDDWRTTGMVVDSGTITHDGDSVDVLVTVSESSAAFYRDIPEQVLFDSVAFPMDIPDAEQAFHSISFDDLDGDGESDVWVSFLHENGDATDLIWIWDPEERAMSIGRICPQFRLTRAIQAIMQGFGSTRTKIFGCVSMRMRHGNL